MRYSGPESLSLKDQTKFDVLIQMEVLSGCEHSCTGCFVNKHNPTDLAQPLLEEAKRLADGVKATGLNLREFIIGPTDFFSASNTKDVLNHPLTQEIMREHTNARIATPAKFDLASTEYFEEIFAILDDEDKFRPEMIIEFVTPIESPDKMVNDKEYFDNVMKKVEFFKHNTPKQMDWSWTLQSSAILSNKFTKEDYNKVLDKAIDEYGTILEMNPAFARAPAHKQKENLFAWNDFLSNVIDNDNYDKATMSMANLYCNSMNFIGLTVLMGENGPETYLNVMLHEQAFFTNNQRTNVTGLSFEEILNRRNDLILEGIQKLSEHPIYKDTPYVVALANRLVWEAIVAMDLTDEESVLPMDVLALYNPTEQGDHLWNEDALKYMKKEIA
jgi:hypothetical protein